MGPRWIARWVEPRRRLALLILAHYYTGLRPGELLHLTTGRIRLDVAFPHIEICETKTDDDRIVPLSSAAVGVFAELVRDRVGRIANFDTKYYWEAVARAAALAGIAAEKRRPYALRHTFATHLIERGVDLRTVAELMGHRDWRSTMGYTVPSDERLRAAVELLG